MSYHALVLAFRASYYFHFITKALYFEKNAFIIGNLVKIPGSVRHAYIAAGMLTISARGGR